MPEITQEGIENELRLVMVETVAAFLLARDAKDHGRSVRELHSAMSEMFAAVAKKMSVGFGLDPMQTEVTAQQIVDELFSNAERIFVGNPR